MLLKTWGKRRITSRPDIAADSRMDWGDFELEHGHSQSALKLYCEAALRAHDAGSLAQASEAYKKAISLIQTQNKSVQEFGPPNALHIQAQKAQIQKNLAQEIELLNGLGSVYLELDEFEIALEYFKQALPGAQQLGNITMEAEIANNLGLARAGLHHSTASLISCFNRAFSLYVQIKDYQGIAETLLNYGDFGSYNSREAFNWYERVLFIADKIEPSAVARALMELALIYSRDNNYPKVVECVESLRSFDTSLPPFEQAWTWLVQGTAYEKIEQLEQAIMCYQEALSIYQKNGEAARARETQASLTKAMAKLKTN